MIKIEQLKESNKMNEIILMGGLTVFCLSLSVFRTIYTGRTSFLFLNWNLFLAFIPWMLTSLTTVKPQLKQSKISFLALLVSWLVFFPNAPYILTDLFHLNPKSPMPMWFDLVLILSYAWTGLLFGFLSLWDIERILPVFVKRSYVPIMTVGLLFSSGFGIYIGRFLRWNSWDVVTKPARLMSDISDRFINPFDHPRTWGVTLFMGLFLLVMYFSLGFIRKRNE